ncbi:MAG: hypothetical protein Q4A64_04000 [Porphyromonadaceae bacterium]|nr:hypothetical protein [Porphyromonadaceae bacterium]
MKKFVSLCAFVAALSFVSCGNKTSEQATADSTAAAAVETVEAAAQEAAATVDSAVMAVDSVATEAVENL